MPSFSKSKHRLSFGYIYLVSNQIAEVIVDNGVELTLSMAEEYDQFLSENLASPFAVLINRINFYTISFEAQLVIGSITGLTAIAVVKYDAKTENVVNNLLENRRLDELNLRQFSGLQLGRSEGLSWLESELLNTKEKS